MDMCNLEMEYPIYFTVVQQHGNQVKQNLFKWVKPSILYLKSSTEEISDKKMTILATTI